jgi:hypothetical protein
MEQILIAVSSPAGYGTDINCCFLSCRIWKRDIWLAHLMQDIQPRYWCSVSAVSAWYILNSCCFTSFRTWNKTTAVPFPEN